MLDRFLQLKTAVNVTIVFLELDFVPLSPAECTELEHIRNLLKPFNTVSTALSAQSYVHASEVSFHLRV